MVLAAGLFTIRRNVWPSEIKDAASDTGTHADLHSGTQDLNIPHLQPIGRDGGGKRDFSRVETGVQRCVQSPKKHNHRRPDKTLIAYIAYNGTKVEYSSPHLNQELIQMQNAWTRTYRELAISLRLLTPNPFDSFIFGVCCVCGVWCRLWSCNNCPEFGANVAGIKLFGAMHKCAQQLLFSIKCCASCGCHLFLALFYADLQQHFFSHGSRASLLCLHFYFNFNIVYLFFETIKCFCVARTFLV